MQQVVELCLAFIDLIKAELELSKKAVFNLGLALGLAFAGVLFLICAVGLILYAIYLAFLSAFDPKWAVFATALGAFACAGVLLWLASYKSGH